MREPKNNIYQMSPDREKELWREAIFVFDSSALLDFYFLPETTRSKIFDELFAVTLKDRLWVPSHVKFEYNKNREKIIKKPIAENYKPLKDDNLKSIRSALKEIENKVLDLKNKTKSDDKHPYLPQNEIDSFSKIVENFKKESEGFEDSLITHINKVEEDINKLPEKDDVLKAVESLFKVGRYYPFDEIIKITQEGKHRYEFFIPPGYEDLRDKDKKGTQIFGDLIIWKQILEFAKKIKKPIILICNDLKEDWCYLSKASSEKRVESPREELIKEIYDHAGVEFWMYNQPQFLYNSNKYFEAEIEKRNIDSLSHFLSNSFIVKKAKSTDELIFDCNRCGTRNYFKKVEMDLDFEFVESVERSKGPENEYQATEYIECRHCENEVNVTFHVWEYPVGVQNYDAVTIDGGNLISCFPFTVNFYDEPEGDTCSKCGNPFHDEQNIGICDECEREYLD